MTPHLRTYSRWRDALALVIILVIAAGVGWIYVRDVQIGRAHV